MTGRRSGTCAIPMPVATIDSPSAIRMISPWRSAKWLADASRQLLPARNAPERSTTSTASQSSVCVVPLVCAAISSSAVATTNDGIHRRS